VTLPLDEVFRIELEALELFYEVILVPFCNVVVVFALRDEFIVLFTCESEKF
jgi:hypothetical protein